MNSAPLDHDLMEGYKRSDVFMILLVGMFIYSCGSSLAYVFSTFFRDVSIIMNATSIATLILKESIYYLTFIIFVLRLGSFVYKKIEATDFFFNRLMWCLIISYFVIQFISYGYSYWGYEMMGIEFVEKTSEYYHEVKDYYTYQMYVSYLRFLPFIFCPLILLYFSNKLKN
ncbi:MAG: hypothetical protein ACI9P5_002657 [Saprospiraceae bacterium]|jgi:hypothetical protein|tara:strand:+ start:190 stop:702 length:513 start_codon:yes stop_codon:yes gene_type:complete